MELTVREALMIGPLAKAQIVAGQDGLDRVIHSVTMMEAPDILDWSNRGDFLVTTSYPLLDRTIPEKEFIPKLYEKGIVGLAAKLHAFLKEYPPSMIEAANQLGFPLIDIPTKHSLMEIIQPLTNEMLERRTAELLQSQAIQRQFIDLVLSGGGFNEIAQAISQLVNYPVSIVDRVGKIIGNSIFLGQDNTFEEFINIENKDQKYLSIDYLPRIVEIWETSKVKHMVANGHFTSFNHMVCPINVGNFQLGQVIVWGGLDPVKNSTESIAVEHGAVIAALKFMEQRSINQVEERFRREILEGLLSKQLDARKKAFSELCNSGFNAKTPYLVILVSTDYVDEKNLQKFEQHNINESLYLVKQHLQIINRDAIFWDRGTNLVVCFPVNQAIYPDFHALNKEFSKVIEDVKRQNNPYAVSMGVSSLFNTYEDFNRAYDYARQSFHIGQVLHRNMAGRITHYEDLGILKIIATSSDSQVVEEFCQDIIGPIVQHDRRYSTELLKTLRVFFDQDLNTAQAAKCLFIHYNTMRYRLDHIESLLGYSLKDSQKRITLQVAVYLYPLIVSEDLNKN
jgi:PucR family transcriptional regulator, purine catabolism regulatory protein